MSKLGLENPKRQSPVGVAVIFFKNLRIAVNVLISLVALQYGFQIDTSSNFFMIAVTFVLLIFVVVAILQYRRFFFYVDGDQFVIERGLLSRDKITIPFDRIQSVHINQNVIQQVLRVVGLKVDTAGSAMKELEIPALERSYARQLQEYLMERKEETREITDEDSLEEGENLVRETTMASEAEEPLVKLSIADVFKVGLTENHLRTGFFLFVVLNGYVWQYEEFLLKPFEPYLKEYEDMLLAQWVILLPIAVLLFLVISVLLSLLQSVLRNFNLRFYLNKEGVQLIAGSVKRVEYQIPLNKIQYIKWSSNPLRKLIGFKTMVVKQAGSNETADRQSLKVPGIRKKGIEAVLDKFFPEKEETEFTVFPASSFYFRRLIIIYGILPALLLSIPAFWFVYALVLPVIWLGFAAWGYKKYVPTVLLKCNRDMLYLQRGWIFPQTIALKYYKLQSISFNQSIFLERRGLANLDFYTAAGSLRMWQLDENTARNIYDYVLYKIESSSKGWM